MVEAGFGQAAVAGAAGAVAGGLVHGALDAGPAGVIGLERDLLFRGADGGLGFGQVTGLQRSWRRLLAVHRARAGQGTQSAAEKVATILSLPCWVHGIQVAALLPCGQVISQWS